MEAWTNHREVENRQLRLEQISQKIASSFCVLGFTSDRVPGPLQEIANIFLKQRVFTREQHCFPPSCRCCLEFALACWRRSLGGHKALDQWVPDDVTSIIVR